MKSVKLKTIEIVNANMLLDEAKYQAMSDDDKVKLWKITRVLNPIAKKYLEDEADAKKKLMPSDNFYTKMQKGAAYEKFMDEKSEGEPPISEDEYKALSKEYTQYLITLSKALKELKNKEESIEIDPLSESAWGKLMASNDWTFKQLDVLNFILE